MSLTPSPSRTYESRVSFDTFDNKDAIDFSFTLRSKHKNYSYSKRSRTFLCGTDQNDYSEFALDWLIDELVDDGDEVVCLRVVDKDSKISSESSVEEGRYRTEAHKLLDQIKAKNNQDEKSISLVLEFAVGKVQETIQRMVSLSTYLSPTIQLEIDGYRSLFTSQLALLLAPEVVHLVVSKAFFLVPSLSTVYKTPPSRLSWSALARSVRRKNESVRLIQPAKPTWTFYSEVAHLEVTFSIAWLIKLKLVSALQRQTRRKQGPSREPSGYQARISVTGEAEGLHLAERALRERR